MKRKPTSRKVQASPLQEQGGARLKEGALIILATLCAYLWMALLTYNVNDPGWTSTRDAADPVSNWGGPVGAWCADVLFLTLGYFAYLFPLLLMLKAWQVYKSREQAWEWDGWLFTWRMLGLLMLVFAGSALAYIHFQPGMLPSSGGALGEGLGRLALSVLNVQGGTLLLLAVFFGGVTVFTELSWLSVMDGIGRYTLLGAGWIKKRVLNWQDARAERRELQAQLVDDDDYDIFAEEEVFEPAPVAKNVPTRKPTKAAAVPKLMPAEVHADDGLDDDVDFAELFTPTAAAGGRIEPVIGNGFISNAPELTARSSWDNEVDPFDDLEPFGPADNSTRHPTPWERGAPEVAVAPAVAAATATAVNTETLRGVMGNTPPPVSADVYRQAISPVDLSDDDLSLDDELPPYESVAAFVPSEGLMNTGAAPRDELPELTVTEAEEAPIEIPAISSISRVETQPSFYQPDDIAVPPPFTAPPRAAVPIVPLNSQVLPEVAAAQPRAMPVSTAVPSVLEAAMSTMTPLPPTSLLDPADKMPKQFSPESLQAMSSLLELRLKEFGVEVTVDSVHPGPVITRFEIQLAPGIKVSRISNLAKDLARSLAVISVRVVEVIPGKTTVGIEVPNEDRQMVRFSEVIDSEEYDSASSPVTIALGHDIGGQAVTADLARMPHLLVAGTTGSGKSVGVNAMILSMLFKSTPEEVRLIMIDPKMLELSIYEGIPHLLCPVVTDMKEAANALRWCVAEMDRRYKLMASMGVRNLAGFNRKVKDAQEQGMPLTDPLFRRESIDDIPPLLEPLPTIVVIVDEFADMMMIVGKKVEELIARIAQKARAAGIHLILATQRPSVDVITGLIKANIPTRIAFQVSSKIDSRTILDQGGAEQLLGHGDMLYMPPGTGLPVRVHGAFVSDDEVHRVVEAWKARGAPNYIEDILSGVEEAGSGFESSGDADSSEDDPLYDEAVRFVTETRRASISGVQRKLKIGYNRAARMIETMEMAGVVTSMNTNGSREVIAPPPMRD